MEEAGDGALQRAFEELKAKLQQEGLFESAAKQQVLSNYQHIGVVTSATGAAIHDILSVFARRFPATRITLFPVAVQGADAADEIVNAIELANRHRLKLKLQALIVGRGGGSLEDLQAFNEERLARAIFASELPVTSAVGHEIDFSIADFVADLRAPTPSAAAELMSPSQQEYSASLVAYLSKFRQIAQARIQQGQQQLDWLLKQLKHPDRRLQEHAQNLDRLEDRMQRAIGNRITLQSSELAQLKRGLLASSPLPKIRQSRLLMDASKLRLKRSLQAIVKAREARLGELSRSLNAVSPLNTLARGYSITYDDTDKVIHSSADVTVGRKITTRLRQGRITSTVDKISE
jgi:exodeoxyribonuclease VII large subunit